MVTITESQINKSLLIEDYLKRAIRERILPECSANRYFNFGRLTKLSKCIGIIGPRGSLKSLSASAIGIIDYMVPGYTLLSNMQVQWGMRLGDYIVGYASQDLDKAEFLNFNIEDRTAVLVDEVNIEFSEARRSITNRNLIFNKITQQLRKRHMNLIYTVQHEMWIDNRLRFQTDIFIKSQDVCMKAGGWSLPYEFGEYGTWKIYDMAGMFGKGSYQDTGKPLAENVRFNGRRWWNTYNTDQIQGIDETEYGQAEYGGIRFERGKHIIVEEEERAYLTDAIQGLHDQGITEVESAKLYEMIGAHTIKDRIEVGKLLKRMGVEYRRWNKSYVIPDADLERPETMRRLVVTDRLTE